MLAPSLTPSELGMGGRVCGKTKVNLKQTTTIQNKTPERKNEQKTFKYKHADMNTLTRGGGEKDLPWTVADKRGEGRQHDNTTQ